MSDDIIGIGTDIIEIDRFRRVMEKHGKRFLERFFSTTEQEHCHKYSDSERRFAARFCAKEATVKALGVGFGQHIGFLDIEIHNQKAGRPILLLAPPVAEHFGHPKLHLSISHSKYYATAVVLATRSE